MYDGVRTHGLLHQVRMEDVFWRRLGTMLKILDLVLLALPRPQSEDHKNAILKAWREVDEAVYVGKREAREEREGKMVEMLERQSMQRYTIESLED